MIPGCQYRDEWYQQPCQILVSLSIINANLLGGHQIIFTTEINNDTSIRCNEQFVLWIGHGNNNNNNGGMRMREGKGLVSRNMLLFDQRNTPLCHTHTNHVKRDRLHKDTFQSPLFFYHYPCLWYSIDTAFQQAYHHHIYIYIYTSITTTCYRLSNRIEVLCLGMVRGGTSVAKKWMPWKSDRIASFVQVSYHRKNYRVFTQ